MKNRTVATITIRLRSRRSWWSVLRLGDKLLEASAIGWPRGWGESLSLTGIGGRLAYSIIPIIGIKYLIE